MNNFFFVTYILFINDFNEYLFTTIVTAAVSCPNKISLLFNKIYFCNKAIYTFYNPLF